MEEVEVQPWGGLGVHLPTLGAPLLSSLARPSTHAHTTRRDTSYFV